MKLERRISNVANPKALNGSMEILWSDERIAPQGWRSAKQLAMHGSRMVDNPDGITVLEEVRIMKRQSRAL
jgi:hypothetical protein